MPAEYIILNAPPAVKELERLCMSMRPPVVDIHQILQTAVQTTWFSFGHDDIDRIFNEIDEVVCGCGLVEVDEMSPDALEYEQKIIMAAFEVAVDLREQIIRLGLYSPKEDYLVLPYDYLSHNNFDINLKYIEPQYQASFDPDGEAMERINVTSAKAPHRAALRSTLNRYRAT